MTQSKSYMAEEARFAQKSLYEGEFQGLIAKDFPRFPSTRFQGSKRKIAYELANAFDSLEFSSALDLFSGTATVSLILRFLGKHVDSNDYLTFNQNTARLFLKIKDQDLMQLDYEKQLRRLLYQDDFTGDKLISKHFDGIFFTGEENEQIDRFCQNINRYSGVEHDLYLYAVGQSLLKKRPYNLFHRANLNMRQRKVKRTFGNAATWETPIIEHSKKCIKELKQFPFDDLNDYGSAFSKNTNQLDSFSKSYDLIYLDPPYLNSKSVGVDYSDFYGFLEGLCDYGLVSKGDANFPHKPINKMPSNWNKHSTALNELQSICEYWKDSIIFLSYRSDGLPTPGEAKEAMKCGGRNVEVHSCGEYKYALSRTNTNEELFLISTP